MADLNIPMPPAIVLDVGLIAGQGWAVIETNPAFASGIYGCDPDAVLRVLRRASTRRSALTEADRKWIVERC